MVPEHDLRCLLTEIFTKNGIKATKRTRQRLNDKWTSPTYNSERVGQRWHLSFSYISKGISVQKLILYQINFGNDNNRRPYYVV